MRNRALFLPLMAVLLLGCSAQVAAETEPVEWTAHVAVAVVADQVYQDSVRFHEACVRESVAVREMFLEQGGRLSEFRPRDCEPKRPSVDGWTAAPDGDGMWLVAAGDTTWRVFENGTPAAVIRR